jgi:hypothetical protein
VIPNHTNPKLNRERGNGETIWSKESWSLSVRGNLGSAGSTGVVGAESWEGRKSFEI